MEYADNGTLHEYLSKNFNKMNWNLKLKFAKQISSAVFCSVPCHNPKKERKVVAIAFATTFYMSQIWLQPSSTIVTRNYNLYQ